MCIKRQKFFFINSIYCFILLFNIIFAIHVYASEDTIKQSVANVNTTLNLDSVFPNNGDIQLGDKPTMLIFGKENCYYCDILSVSLIGNSTIQGYISLNFIPYYINLDDKKKRNIPYLSLSGIDSVDIARLYKLNALPTIIFISGDGEEIMRVAGFPGERRIIAILEFIYNDVWKNFKTQKERVKGFLEYEVETKK